MVSSNLDGLKIHPYNMFQADGSDLLKFRRNELCGSNGFQSVENIVNENLKFRRNDSYFFSCFVKHLFVNNFPKLLCQKKLNLKFIFCDFY